jgi:hypothetical protein
MNSLTRLSHLSPNRLLTNYHETDYNLVKSKTYNMNEIYMPMADKVVVAKVIKNLYKFSKKL